jgi:hypothetical protein
VKNMPRPAKYVQPIHFEDFDGFKFERLVFAYHARTEKWKTLEWYGQAGSDLGRDIWGVREDGTSIGESVCIQCVNRKNLTFSKVEKDISKVLAAGKGKPQRFRIVARSNISAELRDKIKKHVTSLGVSECDTWSGAEFEEFLRHRTESLLKRFIDGEVFPDAPPDLLAFALADGQMNDNDALALMAKLFDRPAFYTRIREESNLADFKQAITDTIQALGTGIWKARDGNVISRLPSRHQLQEDSLRKKIQAVEKALARLRTKFDELIRAGVVRHCPCNNPTCSVYFMPPQAAGELEQLRGDALRLFHTAYPAFEEPSTWQR